MSLFDFFKKKTVANTQVKEEPNAEIPVQRGVATSKRIEVDSQNQDSIRNCFIAFDVETTGLSPTSDRIVEIGAVIFLNGTVHKVFSSLINPGVPISQSASAVNHITNAMLATAPSEREIYPQLIDFLGDALCGKIVMCAHNAKFDFDFLCNTLSRLGFNATIEYVDTLSLSRKHLHGLVNYKQNTIEAFLGLENPSLHRATSDAENCGHILLRLLEAADECLAEEKKRAEKSKPSLQELEVCAYIQRTIAQRGGNAQTLRYRKNSSGYVEINCLYHFLFSCLKFKFAKKGNYILVKSDCPTSAEYITEPCPQSESGKDYLRVYFSSPFNLEKLSDYIYKAFIDCQEDIKEFAAYYDSRGRNDKIVSYLGCALSEDEVQNLLSDARDRNIGNCDNGIAVGLPCWEKGEDERKNGNFEKAIELFEDARHSGYAAPALYDSYAKACRQLKDYSSEIAILEEGIARMPDQADKWEHRKNQAMKLLCEQQERERKAAKRAERKANSIVQKETAVAQPKGKAILQLDSDGNIIKEFDTIAAAVREVGINSKSIRDAANGVQKRAGGYRWMYK